MKAERSTVRGRALEILLRVERGGAWASRLLETAEPEFSDRRDRALLHELVLGVLRRRSVLDALLARCSSRPLDAVDLIVLTAMRIAAYSMVHLDRIPKHAAVSTAVDEIKARRPRAAGYANAVLRALTKLDESEHPQPPEKGDVEALALWSSHPAWYAARRIEHDGWTRALHTLEANNRPAATHLRIKRGLPAMEATREELAAQQCLVRPGRVVPDALRVMSGTPAGWLSQGHGWVQDEASQLVSLLADVRPGQRVLDCCAAPGGKSMHLASLVGEQGQVVAVDRHAGRLRRLQRNVERVGYADRINVVLADMTQEAPLAGRFDRVLVDAPCSGSGTLRRHPEIRWRLDPEQLKLLAERQGRLLERAADRLQSRGRMVYSVCSIEREEGEQVIDAFLARRPEFSIADPKPLLPAVAHRFVADDGSLRTRPGSEGMDGFYAVALERQEAS